jgi:hypothetical protein
MNDVEAAITNCRECSILVLWDDDVDAVGFQELGSIMTEFQLPT